MNILILNYEYPPIGGGAGVVSHKLAEYYAKSGHSVSVVSSAWADYKSNVQENNIDVFRVFAARRDQGRGTFFEMAVYLVSAFVKCFGLCKKSKPDVIHVHFLVPTAIIALCLKKIFKIPYIVTMHGGDVPSFVPNQTGLLFKMVKPIADLVIKNSAKSFAVSPSMCDMAKTDYIKNESKISYIVNGIECLESKPKRTLSSEVINFLFIGRLTPQKNLLFLLEVLEKLSGDFILTVLGEGPQLEEARAYVAETNLASKVVFKGWVEVEQVYEQMLLSDALLMPSLQEGTSIAALQAMSNGLPIIAMKSPGLEEMIEDNITGKLLSNDKEEWIELLDKICAWTIDMDLMSDNSYQKAKEYYAWQKIANRYLQEIGSLL